MLDSKHQIIWTRTRFLRVNPKDSTRTRLVLDTLRLVLDSYSQKVDSTHHYLSRIFIVSCKMKKERKALAIFNKRALATFVKYIFLNRYITFQENLINTED